MEKGGEMRYKESIQRKLEGIIIELDKICRLAVDTYEGSSYVRYKIGALTHDINLLTEKVKNDREKDLREEK